MHKYIILLIFLSAAIQREFNDLKSFNRYFDPSKRVNYLTYLHSLEIELKNQVFKVFGRNRIGRNTADYKFVTNKYIQDFIDKVENKSIFSKFDLKMDQYKMLRNFFDWIATLLQECKAYNALKPVCEKAHKDHFYDIDSTIKGVIVRTNNEGFATQPSKRKIVSAEPGNCSECTDDRYTDIQKSEL